MKIVKIVIEKSKDGYWSYAENVEGITGGGNTVAEAKQSALDSIEIIKGFDKVPKILQGEYAVTFKFDMQSFFEYYKKIFNKAGLQQMTGISQGQLQHYAKGVKKPRPVQAKKIEAALHKLGSELMAVEL